MTNALTSLEAESDWTKLLDEDREEIAAKLRCDLSATAENGDPVRLLQTLLVRRRTLPGLIEELKTEIKRRQPPVPEPVLTPDGGNGDEAGEEIVEADDLVQPVVIVSTEGLDSWLASIREKLEALLKAGKKIKLTSGRKGG